MVEATKIQFPLFLCEYRNRKRAEKASGVNNITFKRKLHFLFSPLIWMPGASADPILFAEFQEEISTFVIRKNSCVFEAFY
jgi:hypothetical protein